MSNDNVQRFVPNVEMTEGVVRCVAFKGITEEAVLMAAARWVGERRETTDDSLSASLSWHTDMENPSEDVYTLTLHFNRMDEAGPLTLPRE